MKIKREINGEPYEFELTPAEALQAYNELELKMDINTIQFHFMDYTDEDFLDEYGIHKKEAENRFPDIARELRRNINRYDMQFDYALSSAITDVL